MMALSNPNGAGSNAGGTDDNPSLAVASLALDEARRHYDDTRTRFEALRQRLLGVLGYSTAGIAFLTGAVVTKDTLPSDAKGFAFAGTIFFGLFVLLTLVVAWPRRWEPGLSATALIEAFDDSEINGGSTHALRSVARAVEAAADENDLQVRSTYRVVPAVIVCCGLAQVLMLVAVWRT